MPCCAADLEQISADLAALGYEAPVGISATSGDGMADLYQLLQPLVDGGEEQLRQQWQQSRAQQQQQQQGKFVGLQALPTLQQHTDVQDLNNVAAAAAAAEEEAVVDALLQQRLASTAAAAVAGDFSSNEESGTFLDPSAAAAAADGCASDLDEEQTAAESAGVTNQGDSSALGPLRLAILGLPNVGKSTLMNTLLGYERSLTGGSILRLGLYPLCSFAM